MTSKATTSYRLIYQYMIVHLMSMQYSTYICLANYLGNSHSPEKLLKHLVMFVLPTDWYFLHHGHIDILGCYPYYLFFWWVHLSFFFKKFFVHVRNHLNLSAYLMCPRLILCPWLPFKTLSTNVSTSIKKTLNTNTSRGRHVSSLFTATTTLEMPRARILAHEIFRDEMLCVLSAI